MRHLRACLVFIALLFPSVAHAHDHRWDFSFAAATASGSRLWGGRYSVGLTKEIRQKRNLSVLLDVTNVKGNDKTQDKTRDITQLSYLGGLRYAVPRISGDHFAVMLHGLGGGVYKQKGATGDLNLALTTGAALEWVPRGTPDGWAARLQIEQSFLPDETAKGFTQISIGVVKRFN
jgi:hypothetical protein